MSFMKTGRRKSIRKNNKGRIKEVYKILEELDRVAIELLKYSAKNKKAIDKKDLKELAETYTDLEVGEMEQTFLWSKLNSFEEHIINSRTSEGNS